MWAFSEPLALFGAFLFKPLQGNKHFELVFVMILFPGVLNCVYFWIADSFLKAKSDAPGNAHEISVDESGKKDALLNDVAETEIANTFVPKPWASISPTQQRIHTEDLSNIHDV